MFRLMLGIVLMGVSVIVMIFMLQDPAGQPALADLFKDLYCGPGETVRQMVSTSGGSLMTVNGRGVFYVCVNDAGTGRDITDKVALTIGLAFAVPFVVGLLLFLSGIFGMVRGAALRAAASVDVIGLHRMLYGTGGFTPRRGGDLTDRLEEIKEALDKGLISQEEYNRLRRRILDDLNPL